MRALAICLVVTCCVAAVGCASQVQGGDTVDELPPTAQKAAPAVPKAVEHDYGSVYLTDPDYVRTVKSALPQKSGAEAVLSSILGYAELQKKSEIYAALDRAVYTYKLAGVADCPSDRRRLPLRAIRRTGAEYLSELFFRSPYRPVPDAVVAGLFRSDKPEPFQALAPDQQVAEALEHLPGPTDAVFCQPLKLNDIVPALAELKDVHPFVYASPWAALNQGIEVAKWSAHAKGQYIPVPVWGLLRQELDELKAAAPFAKPALDDVRLAINYKTDEFVMKVEPDGKTIEVSAVLIRHVLLVVVAQDAAALMHIERRRNAARLDEAAAEQQARELAVAARKRLGEIFSVALAHELAHIYLGKNGRLELDEVRVDCFAVSNVSRARRTVRLGLMEWLYSDLSGEATRFWSVEDQAGLNAVKTRVERLKALAALPEQVRNDPARLCPG